jgi:hypothetical protein
MINKVTITGRMKTWMKYILVTVPAEREDPPKRRVATYFPINGVELAMLIPMVAAPNARLSQGSR